MSKPADVLITEQHLNIDVTVDPKAGITVGTIAFSKAAVRVNEVFETLIPVTNTDTTPQTIDVTVTGTAINADGTKGTVEFPTAKQSQVIAPAATVTFDFPTSFPTVSVVSATDPTKNLGKDVDIVVSILE